MKCVAYPSSYCVHFVLRLTFSIQVIRAATSDAAKTLGLWDSIGSISPGKLADFLVYQPGVDLLEGEISGSTKIRYVVRGGRVWDADTLVEEWPVEGRKAPLPPLNPE